MDSNLVGFGRSGGYVNNMSNRLNSTGAPQDLIAQYNSTTHRLSSSKGVDRLRTPQDKLQRYTSRTMKTKK